MQTSTSKDEMQELILESSDARQNAGSDGRITDVQAYSEQIAARNILAALEQIA